MARTVLMVLGSLLLVAHHASAAVHRVKLAKRSNEEFVQTKLAQEAQEFRNGFQDHFHEGPPEPR